MEFVRHHDMSFATGVQKAAEIIDSGKALAKLDQLVAFCRDLQ